MKYGFEMRSDSCFARKKNRFAMHDDSCFARKMMRCGAPRNFRKLAAMAILLASVLTCAGLARAETLSGTVTNGTTGKPAAGDDVVLLMLAQGMQEAGRAKTDAQGKFSFNITDSGGPHLVRVNHQGVNYFPAGGPIRPGATTTGILRWMASSMICSLMTARPGSEGSRGAAATAVSSVL